MIDTNIWHCSWLEVWLSGRPSAAVPRGNARTPPGSAKIIFWWTLPNVRRTFGGLRRTPRRNGRICAESTANWRKSSLEKCPPTKTYLSPLLLAEELPHRTTLRGGNTHRVSPPNVRRTFGGVCQKIFLAEVRRIRAEPGGLPVNPRGFAQIRGGSSSAEPIAEVCNPFK